MIFAVEQKGEPMRLINADALPKYNGYALSADAVARAVENAPTIDAEPVVRCKDCVWKYGSECTRFAEVRVSPDDYCSRGEAKMKRGKNEKEQSEDAL